MSDLSQWEKSRKPASVVTTRSSQVNVHQHEADEQDAENGAQDDIFTTLEVG